METDILGTAVVLAFIGGFTVNLLSLLELQHVPKDRRPNFRDALYWLPFVVWPFLGALTGYLYDDPVTPIGKLLAFHVGLSSPLILKTMATAIPAQVRQQLPDGA